MKTLFTRWTTRAGVWIQRAQYAIIALLLLGAIDYFAAYDLLITLFGTLGPGAAPLIALVVLFLVYKGYRRYRRNRRGGEVRSEADDAAGESGGEDARRADSPHMEAR